MPPSVKYAIENQFIAIAVVNQSLWPVHCPEPTNPLSFDDVFDPTDHLEACAADPGGEALKNSAMFLAQLLQTFHRSPPADMLMGRCQRTCLGHSVTQQQ